MSIPVSHNPPIPQRLQPDPLASDRPWPIEDPLARWQAPERVERIDAVLRQRVVSLCAVFEDIFDPHNVAACLRTCEAYGVHDLHWIQNKHDMRLSSTVAKSADQWIDLYRYSSTEEGVAALKAAGFAIWVSDLSATRTLRQLPVDGKVAIVVGNAKDGISPAMRAAADERYLLPMHGMVQSFNLSVALAITLDTVVPKRREQLQAAGMAGDMDVRRMWNLRRRWLEYGQRNADVLRRELGDPELP
jgi:tRNA (guanosine-2'-O-)-methyltransferase